MASLFIPLTFITSVYSMNFDHMPEFHWRSGYPTAWDLMVVAALGLVAWFGRRGWPSALRSRSEDEATS